MTLWRFRYKGDFSMNEAFVEASSLEKAKEVAQRWCDRESRENRPKLLLQVIGGAVVADESILDPEPKVALLPPPEEIEAASAEEKLKRSDARIGALVKARVALKKARAARKEASDD